MDTVTTNGASIPSIGFGTWTLRQDQATDLVSHAIETGYRHIDTATIYENETAVGRGIRAAMLPREDLFLATKVWLTDLAAGDLQASAKASLQRLGVEYVDLLLIHWPSKTIALEESIHALNEVATLGWTKHIGVSNFTVSLMAQAAQFSERPLVCNQIEYHPMLNQNKVLSACNKQGLAVVSYCPLFRGGELLNHETIKTAAKKHKKSPAQIVLRWHLQHPGVIAIPRSTSTKHITENIAVFDFTLDETDMNNISALRSKAERLCDFDYSPDWDL